MDQVRHLAGLRKSVFKLQPETGSADYLISPAAKDSHPLERSGKQSAKQSGKVSGKEFTGEKLPQTEEALRQSQHELQQLSVQLLKIQETERQRIAADLHDGIGQSLSLIKLSMESVAQLIIAGEQQKAVESVHWMINKVKEAMAELRRTTSDLRPSTLDDLGIVPTMTWFFREFEMVCHGKTIEKNFIVNESEVPVPLKPTIFRILQEAMNNIVKHADADLIRVELKNAEGLLQLSIEDNGKGFDQAGVSVRRGANRGFGLLTMKERARSSNGTFEIHSTPGSGTRVQIAWRLKESAARQSDTDMSHTLDR